MVTVDTAAPASALARRRVFVGVEQRELLLFGVATLAAWQRLSAGRKALTSILFGLFWGLAVVPYHVVPLLQGSVTGQNVSGLSRLVGGAAMVALGVAILRRRDRVGSASVREFERR
jgi:hypothetical protein